MKAYKAQTLSSIFFVCFATKATHLETVSDLSAGAFVAALRRFVDR